MKRYIIPTIVLGILVAAATVFFRSQQTPAISPFPIATAPTATPTPEPDLTTNYLLLGYGGGNHDGAYLTDSMLIVRIDPVRKKTFLISLPRDLWVTLPLTKEGKDVKINSAYVYGMDDTQFPDKPSQYKGIAGARDMVKMIVSQVTGINIQHIVAVDFSGFTKGIDVLGGVDVNVPATFEDPEYPIDGKETDLCGKTPADLPELEKIATISATQAFPCRYETIKFTQGITHMDGATALKFVRSRHSPTNGSDFARSQRQRSLLLAVKDKLLSLNAFTKVPDFYRAVSSNISTDLTTGDIAGVVVNAKTWSTFDIVSTGLSDENVLDPFTAADGEYALISIEGEHKWTIIKNYLSDETKPEKPKKAPLTRLLTTRKPYKDLLQEKQNWDDLAVPIFDAEFLPAKSATQSSLLITGAIDKSIISTILNRIPGIVVSQIPHKIDGADMVLTVVPSPTPTAASTPMIKH